MRRRIALPFLARPSQPEPATCSRPLTSFASHKRLIGVTVGFCLSFIVLVLRLWQVTVLNNIGDEAETVQKTVRQARADLVDRNGILLATNVRTFSVYATPHLILDPQEAAQELAALFPDIPQEILSKRLSSSKRFAWITRHVTPQDKERVLALGIPGIALMEDQRRVWPHGPLFCHILGLTNVDQTGISGLEKGLNTQLHQRETPFVLSLDIRIQHILRDELRQAMEDFQADAGNALLVKTKTGEIIASVSLPDFNPHMPTKALSKALFNRNMTGVYEFGSLLKIHNTVMVLESGLANLNSIYDASVPLAVGRFSIKDFRGKNRALTLREAFLFSSNIANAKMALSAGIPLQKAFFQKMGFGEAVSLEIPERAVPLMPSTWQESTLITASYGYGIAITPLHMIQSFNTIVTGHRRPLTLIKQEGPVQGAPVLKPQTVRQIRFLLKEATINGQATKAAVPEYGVGAKTGTANLRNDKGRYLEGQNMTSCISAFPIEDPEYTLLFTLERPRPNQSTHGFTTGGWVAAPRTARIIKRCAPFLGLLPQNLSSKNDEMISDLRPVQQPPLLLTLDPLLTQIADNDD